MLARGEDDDVAEDGLSGREKFLRMALITVGAALVASAFSLYSQRNDGDPHRAAAETVAATSGATTTVIEVVEAGGMRTATAHHRFDGDDYHLIVTTLGDGGDYGSSIVTQELLVVAGQTFYLSDDTEGWEPTPDTSALVLDEVVALPADLVGWSSAGLTGLIDALGLEAGEADRTESVTLDLEQLRAVAGLPPPLAVLADGDGEWPARQPVEITISQADGAVVEVVATARDDRPERADGPRSVTITIGFDELGQDQPIAPPPDS